VTFVSLQFHDSTFERRVFMLDLSLIPVLGVLALIGLSVFVESRRAGKVAEVKAESERHRQQILRDDGLNDQALVESLLRGVGMDQAVSQFVAERSRLLPGVNPEAPAGWTVDQLEDWSRREVRRGVDDVNRRMTVPAFATAIIIIAVCVVSTVILYQFRSGPDPSAASDSAPLSQATP
jgi:hypothetical protein